MSRVLGIAVLLAANPVAHAEVANAHEVTLSQAEILKVQWDTRDLTAMDLDGDGRQDLAVINNDEARIDLYYQLADGERPGETGRKISVDRWEPVLDDARFERVKVLTGGIAYDLALGDLNGDQRPDLVYANDRNELVVHLQSETGGWEDKRYFEFSELATVTGNLWIGDLLNDGKNDLVALTTKSLMIFHDGDMDEQPERYACVHDSPLGLTVRDLNDDGRLDLIYYYLSHGEESAMTVRFQGKDNRFVSERFFEFKRSANLPVPVNWRSGEKERSFVAISSVNRTLVELIAGPVIPDEDSAKKAALSGSFEREAYAVPNVGSGESFYAVADFTGDKRLDVVASDGAGAQIWFFRQTEEGRFSAPESFPAFANISGLAAGDTNGNGRAELIMVSEEEGVLGVTGFSEAQRFAYPDVIPLERAPKTMLAGDINADGVIEIVCAVEGESNRTYGLVLAAFDPEEKIWVTRPLLEDEVGSRLQGLRLADVNQDGTQDVLVLSRVQPLEVILQGADGTFTAVETNLAGVADKVAPESVSLGDLDGDGKRELLVTRETFVRSVRLGADGRAQVMDQVNAPDVSASLIAAVAAGLDDAGSRQLLLVDGKTSKINVMARDETGVYRLSSSHPGVSGISSALLTEADGDDCPDLFLFGKSHFWWYRLRPDDFAIEERQIYETDLKDTVYSELCVGSLNSDSRDDLAVFDTANSNVMELLLTAGEDGAGREILRSVLHFKLFEVDPHFQGQRGGRFQPHASVIADLNADGKDDIAILVHDRLIIYPQG